MPLTSVFSRLSSSFHLSHTHLFLVFPGRGQYNCSLLNSVPAAYTAGDALNCSATSPDCQPNTVIGPIAPGGVHRQVQCRRPCWPLLWHPLKIPSVCCGWRLLTKLALATREVTTRVKVLLSDGYPNARFRYDGSCRLVFRRYSRKCFCKCFVVSFT